MQKQKDIMFYSKKILINNNSIPIEAVSIGIFILKNFIKMLILKLYFSFLKHN